MAYPTRVYPHRYYSLLSPVTVFDRILKPLLWIIFNVSIALLLLYLVPLPSVRQMSVFMASGLIGCAITLILIFPSFNPGPIAESDFSKKMLSFSHYFPRFSLKHWQEKPTDYSAIGITVAVILLSGYMQLNFSQNIQHMTYISEELKDEENQVQQLLSLPSTDKFFIVTASSGG